MTLAIVFDSVGVGEWFILLAVVLIVVGPKNLPGTIRKFGNYYSKFRRAAESFKRQLMEMDTELNNVIKDAEKEVEAAVSIPEASDYQPSETDSPEGADAYGREYDSADYTGGGDYMEEDYYGSGGYLGENESGDEPSGDASGEEGAGAVEAGTAVADADGANAGVKDGDKTTAES